MSSINSAFIPYKKALIFPLFVLMIFVGSVLISWSTNIIYGEFEARRDAEAFSRGQYDSIAWAEFTAKDVALTQQDLSVRLYNEGMTYVASAYKAITADEQTRLFALAAIKFQEAFFEAEAKSNPEMMGKAASAMGSTLLRVGLAMQDISLLEKADVMLVKALVLNPKDQIAKWNLELMRRLYKPSEDPSDSEGNNNDIGPGGIDPGKGGL